MHSQYSFFDTHFNTIHPSASALQLDDRGANHEASLKTGRIWLLIRTEQDGGRSASTIQGRMPPENARVMMLQVVGLSMAVHARSGEHGAGSLKDQRRRTS